jgi:hypothetical protein
MPNSSSSGRFIWQIRNNSYISIHSVYDVSCDIQNVASTISSQKYLGVGVAYIMGGTPVMISATGAPFDQGNEPVHSFGMQEEGVDLQEASHFLNWASQCLPVFSKNSVRCQQIGQVTVNNSRLAVKADGCTITANSYTNPNIQDAIVSGSYTGDGIESGQATIVFGATNNYATYLASAMKVHPRIISSPFTFSVACSVDIAPSISFS